MRTLGVAARVLVDVETPGENHGDGATFDDPRPVYASVQQERVTSTDPTGQTRTRPLILLVDHDEDVPVGARVTVDGETSRVSMSKLVRGPFGVPHHREVTAQ